MTAPILFALVCMQVADLELLPAPPEGWRTERLAFPLEFAPDIEIDGFEEIALAPGMFERGSPTYWSYALAIRSKQELDIDAAYLQSFLERYYRGLCETVGGSREMELDLDAIQARVERGAHGHRATVDLFDPFTTGQALQLALEIEVLQRDGGTELLGLASPQPRDGAAWEALDALGGTWRAARPSVAYLNHLFLVPDAATYAAIADSEFFARELGPFEERTTRRADLTYTGVYVYGASTYFEFLRPDPDVGFGPGASGIAFGLEQRGATAEAAERLAARGIQSFAGSRTRELDGEQIPWFQILGVQQPTRTARLNLFTMEYDPRFLERWHAELAPAAGGIERRAVLGRYAARLEAQPQLLGDVIEVRLTLDAAERERFLEACRALGHTVAARGDQTLAQGPGIIYVISKSDTPGRVVGFVTSLRRHVPERTLQLGQLEVELKNRTATFTLR